MTNFEIKINTKRLSDYSARLDKSLEKKTLLLMIESFSHYILNFYGRVIEEEIYSKRYKGKWEPIEEEGYIEYLGVTPKIEIIYLIQDALEVKKIGSNFVVRFNTHYEYPGTDISLLKVLRAIEYGTSKFNSRPILAKSARKIQDNIFDLWRGYLMMKGVV